MPKVSVIIPTYNRSSISRAINSVLNQTYTSWELLIINDASTDDTGSWLLKNFQNHEKIKIFTNSTNQGVSYSRNQGIKKAKGEWLAFLDSDDEWLPDKLEKQIALSSQYPVIHGEEIWIRNSVRVNPRKKHKKQGGRIFLQSLPLCVMSPSTIMIHKSVFETVGLFREDFPVCEDYELWLRITSQFEVGFITDFLIKKYGGHEDQLSRKYFAMDYWRILSLKDYLCDTNITKEEQEEVKKEIIKKSEILLKGYKKHNNMENFETIKKIREESLKLI